MSEARRAESNGGEGRIRTFEATGATDLQSVAFDRFATSPNPRQRLNGVSCRNPMRIVIRFGDVPFVTAGNLLGPLLELAKGFEPPTG